MACGLCPRRCNADRKAGTGFCGVGENPVVAKAYLHRWEEPCISGTGGSGTVFFSGCNLKCVFCQNYKISRENFGKEVTVEKLASIFHSLQEKGAHNINLVTPTHFVLQIRDALKIAGLTIPVLYNSNGYDSLECLKLMEGLVDIYLPDLKYYSADASLKYSGAVDYFETASAAVLEMYRQVGLPEFDSDGMLKRGLMIRHLILPGLSGESVSLLKWIRANLPVETPISLMCQYTPYGMAAEYPEINRRITRWEYDRVLDSFLRLGFENGYFQEKDSALEEYIPSFDLEGVED